ncbi:MAG: hypothetical protein ABSD67_00430 [Terracidiphilus sp.]|jgi:CRISPR/Cas system-associated endoribonuclease Cas2
MKNESVETILKQLGKAVELLLKQEATRVQSSLPSAVLDEEDEVDQLSGELRRMASDLHQAIADAE